MTVKLTSTDLINSVVVVNPNPVVAKVYQQRSQVARVFAGAPGAAGAGSSYASRTAFAYNDVTILPLYLAQAGDRVARIELALTTAFSDPASALSVGDSGNTQRLLTTAQVRPAIAATFESYPLHLYSTSTQINLYISPGVSSAGAGIAYVYLA